MSGRRGVGAQRKIVAGNQITGVNIGLTLGGHLTGTVTVQQAGPATGGYVSLYTQQDTPMFTCAKAPIDAILAQLANVD